MHSATGEESHDAKEKGKSCMEQSFNTLQWPKIAIISRYLHKNQPCKSCQQSNTEACRVSWAGVLPASEEEINISCLKSCLQWDKMISGSNRNHLGKKKMQVKLIPQLPPKISSVSWVNLLSTGKVVAGKIPLEV